MGYFNRKYFIDDVSESLEHRAKYGTANSVSEEKGTDNKKNNTSEYNHDYYMKHKEKWAQRSDYSKDDKDFDDKNYDDEKNLIPDTDLYSFKNADGKTVILFEDTKWTLPEGAELTPDMKEKLQKLFASEGGPGIHDKISEVLNAAKSDEKEFDVDAAARDVISGKYKNGAERKAALGDDYEMVQKRVNEMLKGGGSSSSKKKSSGSSEQSSSSSSSSSSKSPRSFGEAYKDYKGTKSAKGKGKKFKSGSQQASYYKNKGKKSIKHSDDIGSILIRDII